MLGLSAKAVAAWLRVTPQRVSQMANRDHLVLVVAARFANRWLDWIAERRWREGAAALLPTDAEEVAGVRVWLALSELARGRPELTEIFERARRLERAALVDANLGPDELELDLVLATVEGLRVKLCDPGGSLTPDQARTVLARLLELLGADTAEAA